MSRSRDGFSLIELVVAIFILAFGVLGMATTALFVTRQLTLSEAATARVVALQDVFERIQATPFDSVGTGQASLGAVAVSWAVTTSGAQTKAVRIVTVGPGLLPLSDAQPVPMLSNAVADTILYRVLRP